MKVINIDYDVGDTITLSCASTHNNTLIDKSLFTLTIKPPALASIVIPGSDAAFALNATTGKYEYTHTITVPGRHFYRFACSNPAAADEWKFDVRATEIT